MKIHKKISFLTFIISIILVDCTHYNNSSDVQKTEINETLNSIDKEKQIEEYQKDLINFENIINLNEVKNQYKNYTTSTILSKELSKFYYKPEIKGFFGQYILIRNENDEFERIGFLTVYNGEKPWLYENTSDKFIEIIAIRKGLYVFDSIEVGTNVKELVTRLGVPCIKMSDYFIYHDSKSIIAIFKFSGDKINWFKVGLYNDNIMQDINKNINHLLDYDINFN